MNFRNQYKKIGSLKTGIEVIINAKTVTRELIDHILMRERPRSISFSDRVEIIDEYCLYRLNIDTFYFDSAFNIKEIREGAFKKVRHFHCADSFDSVSIVGESAFEEAESEDALYLPNVISVPDNCFRNARFLDVILPNVEQIADSAVEGLQLANSKSV